MRGVAMRELVRELRRVGRLEAIPAYQRLGYAGAAALVLSGFFHVAVYLFDGGGWEGPSSWRKPIVFGLSFGVTLATLVWMFGFLRCGRVLQWILAGILTVTSLGEVMLVTQGATAGPAPARAGHVDLARTGWRVQPTPNAAGATINELSAVSCATLRACTAVGSHAADLSRPSLPLAERWNGRRWRIQHASKPPTATSATLFGVSCPSAADCTAVGTVFDTAGKRNLNLAEVRHGRRWRVVPTPDPRTSVNDALHAVSCTSSGACTAVGHYDTADGREVAMVARWNGIRWRLQALPRLAGSTPLLGVSCATARSCMAVGYRTSRSHGTRPLVELWTGGKWRRHTVRLPAGSPGGMLTAVSCTGPGACTATGANFGNRRPTLAERWNGVRWRIQPTPFPVDSTTSHQEVELNTVSCTSASACTATGAYAPGGHPAYFLETWRGRRWRLVSAPHPALFAAGALNGVSCLGRRCAAVGAWSGGPVPVATLAVAD